MRHGHNTAPNLARFEPSHQIARCTACHSILDFATDGMGRMVESCPHCHWGWPLDRTALLRQAQETAPVAITPAEQAAHDAFRRRTLAAAASKRISDDQHRAQVVSAIQRFVARHGRPPTGAEMGHTARVQVPGMPSRSLVQRLFGSHRHALEAAGIALPERASNGNTRRGKVGRGMVMRRVVG